MHLILLDTETTGLQNPRLVQLGYKDLLNNVVVDELFKPPSPIEYGAMATHHFTNEMVANKPVFSGSEHFQTLLNHIQNGAVIIAHNAPFDLEVLKNEGIVATKCIDTCRVAQHTIDSEQHKLQYLRYSLKLPVDNATAHNALGDVLVLEALFEYLKTIVKNNYTLQSEDEVLQKMIELSRTPILLKAFTFGKYNGKTFEEVSGLDKGYLEWLYNSETQKSPAQQREELVFTLQHYLQKQDTPIQVTELPF